MKSKQAAIDKIKANPGRVFLANYQLKKEWWYGNLPGSKGSNMSVEVKSEEDLENLVGVDFRTLQVEVLGDGNISI